jgi:hypothetical protein
MVIQKVTLHCMLSVHPSNFHPISNTKIALTAQTQNLPGCTLEISQSDIDAWFSDMSLNTNARLWAPGVFFQGLIETAGAQNNTGATNTSKFQGGSGHLAFQDYGSLVDFNTNMALEAGSTSQFHNAVPITTYFINNTGMILTVEGLVSLNVVYVINIFWTLSSSCQMALRYIFICFNDVNVANGKTVWLGDYRVWVFATSLPQFLCS